MILTLILAIWILALIIAAGLCTMAQRGDAAQQSAPPRASAMPPSADAARPRPGVGRQPVRARVRAGV